MPHRTGPASDTPGATPTAVRRSAAAWAAVLLPWMGIGCEPTPSPEGAEVYGVVTLDGAPLDDGQIAFSEPGEVPQILPIRDGRFVGTVRPGPKRVEIDAYRPAPPPAEVLKSQPELASQFEGYRLGIVDPRFNRESRLEVVVGPGTNPELRYAVTSILKAAGRVIPNRSQPPQETPGTTGTATP